MTKLAPIIRVHHGGPGVAEHTNTLGPTNPQCTCGHVTATFDKEGTMKLHGDKEYFPLTITAWGVMELVVGPSVGVK